MGSRLLGAALAASLAMGATAAEPPVPGTVIDASNVDQYAEYLLGSTAELVRRGEVLKVVPTSPPGALITPVWAEATARNRGKAVLLDEYGTVGLADGSPWIGGTPFPEPKSGLEVMVNYVYCNMGLEAADDWGSINGPYAPMSRLVYVNRSGRPYKDVVGAGGQVRMNGRVVQDPKPVIPGREDEFLRRYVAFIAPYDVKGIVTLDIQYQDQSRLPDSYIYLPTFRRVRRVSTANRADSLAGSDFTQSDISGFTDPLGLWKFRIVERKPMLLSISNAQPPAHYPEPVETYKGFFVAPHSSVELRDAFVIEATPRYETVYSRKLLVIDAEVFRITDATFFDRQDKPYKAFREYWGVGRGGFPDPRWQLFYNLQTGSGTIVEADGLTANVGLPLRVFEPAALKEFSR